LRANTGLVIIEGKYWFGHYWGRILVWSCVYKVNHIAQLNTYYTKQHKEICSKLKRFHTSLTPTPSVSSPDHCKLSSSLPLLLSTPEPESCKESEIKTKEW